MAFTILFSVTATLALIILSSNGQQISATSPNTPTSTNPSGMKYIEAALANIIDQITGISVYDKDVTHSLTSVTSLLQLSLLKEVLANSKTRADNGENISEEEVIQLLYRIEEQINITIRKEEDNEAAIVALQEEITAMFSILNSMRKDIKAVLKSTQSNVSSSQYSATSLPTSCSVIKSSSPNSPSGYYTIIDNNGRTRHVYCDMSELCGSSEGWTRVAYLNMSDPQEKCPDGFKLYETNGVRACGRPSSGCVSSTFPSDGISYSEVCGKVIGYQYGSTDGCRARNYPDSISLTHGYPRSHIWSFIAGVYESGWRNDCPCGKGSVTTPSFIGKHYFCESAASPTWQLKLYTDDSLWDGKGCGPNEGSCCSVPGLPWFHRSFPYTTDDYIEMRLCCDEGLDNEDIPVSLYEIYVK